jgi:hypothetical protein
MNQTSKHSNEIASRTSIEITKAITKYFAYLCNCFRQFEIKNKFQKSFMKSCTYNYEDRIRSKSTMSSPKLSKNLISEKEIQESGHSQELGIIGISDCQIATGSHVTLSSHFEENNWDYNFATRGLYLSQPWVRLKINSHVAGSESSMSAVLTLDPTRTEIRREKNDSRVIEMNENGESETDGYYA